MSDPVAPTFPNDVRRHVVRLAGDFFLNGAQVITTAIDTDLVTGMIFLAIVRANVRHLLEEPGAALDYFCLLYTSPSPRDRTRSRMPSSA